MSGRLDVSAWLRAAGVFSWLSLGGCYEEPPITSVTEGDGTAAGCTVTAACDTTGTSAQDGTTTDTPGTTPADASGSTGAPEDGSTSIGPADTSESGADTSSGPGAVWGDGMVDPDTEMCDGTPGCLDDCTFASYDCNPLSNAGCGPGLRCGLYDAPTEDFACMPPGEAGVGAECVGLPGNDSDCADGLTCLFNPNTPLCDVANCCVEYCNLLDAAVTCSGGAECRPFFPNPMYQGLEHLGFCGEPL